MRLVVKDMARSSTCLLLQPHSRTYSLKEIFKIELKKEMKKKVFDLIAM